MGKYSTVFPWQPVSEWYVSQVFHEILKLSHNFIFSEFYLEKIVVFTNLNSF